MPAVIAVVDGQGGGIGSAVVRALRDRLGQHVEVWALGTNAIATAQMMKAGANKGATGENAVVLGVQRADVVLGPIGIALADAFMGEMTEAMAAAVSRTPALKMLLPLTRENVQICGTVNEPLPHLVDDMMERLMEAMRNV